MVGELEEMVILSGVQGWCPCPVGGCRIAMCLAGAWMCQPRVGPVPGGVVDATTRVSAGGAGGMKSMCWGPSMAVLGGPVIATGA